MSQALFIAGVVWVLLALLFAVTWLVVPGIGMMTAGAALGWQGRRRMVNMTEHGHKPHTCCWCTRRGEYPSHDGWIVCAVHRGR